MLIRALNDYYDNLKNKGLIIPSGYSKVKIHYKICLNEDGKLMAILPLSSNDEGSKTKFTELLLPTRTEKTAIEANNIEHRGAYIFGLESEKNKVDGSDIYTYSASGKKALKSHEAFVKKNLEYIENIDSPIVNAYRSFIEKWKPENETNNELLLTIAKSYSTSNFVFALHSNINTLLHEDPKIKKKNETQDITKVGEDSAITAQCAISGKEAEIARIHKKIKGLPKGQSSGTVLVGFNNTSEESYGASQSYNSNISEDVMLRYTESLNFLLSSQNHKKTLGDLTILYWANSPDEVYEELFTMLLMGSNDNTNEEDVDRILDKSVSLLKSGTFSLSNLELMEKISEKTDFFLIGLKPNVSRISLKFIYRKKADTLFKNVIQHQIDIGMGEAMKALPLWRLDTLLENANISSKEKTVDPSFYAKLLEAIVNGSRYPESLLQTLIRRMKYDDLSATSDITMRRAGLIKGFLNREQRLLNKEEEYTMALNRENNNPAYLCGRLFALLEKLQLDAANSKLNRTIRESYFASASSKPSVVFPKLLKLSQHHISKLNEKNKGYSVNIEKNIDEVFSLLGNEFPEYLQLREQGKFMIGYYQQMKDLYTKKEKNDEKIDTDK